MLFVDTSNIYIVLTIESDGGFIFILYTLWVSKYGKTRLVIV